MRLPGPLVSPEWLREHVGAPGLVVADVRWAPNGSARDAYEAGHIPGSVFFDLDRDLARPPSEGPGRHPLPSPEAFAERMAFAGIGDGTTVVAYDDAKGSIAARLWWMLDVTGHAAAVLDGGLQAWGEPLEVGPPAMRDRAEFTARPWPADRVVDGEGVGRALAKGSVVVLDARAAERYRGEVEPFDPVAGHIPGARSAPWTGNIDPSTGRFLRASELRERYVALGVKSRAGTIAYCGSGTTACHDVLAIRLAGLGDALLYEGSWSDWCSDPFRPVTTGEP